MKIRTDWEPKDKKSIRNTSFIDPISGQTVEGDINEHMRIMLLDPKWRENKKLQEEKGMDSNYSTNDQIGQSLGKFADRRSDIFGYGNEFDNEVMLISTRTNPNSDPDSNQKNTEP